MTRKRQSFSDVKKTDPTVVSVSPPNVPPSLPRQMPIWADGPPVPLANKEATQMESQETSEDLYQTIFSRTSEGLEMGENRRFTQRLFMFHERPDRAIIDQLTDHGFPYRPAEKSWAIQASPETPRLSEELAQRFSAKAPGLNR